jgi:cob(I)alamin adenosyltransferase
LTGAGRAKGAREVFVNGGDDGKVKGKGKGKEGKESPSQEMIGLVDALLKFTQMTREDVSWFNVE